MTRIVAIHGFLGRPTDWSEVEKHVKSLAPEVEFQTVDLFSSVPNAKEKTMLDWAKKFNRTQKSRHAERNILVGYSLGGRLALQAAYDKPGLWDEVVLISAHPGMMTDEERHRRKSSDDDWAQKFLNLPWTEAVKLWNGQPVFIGSQEPARVEGEYSRERLAHALVNWSLADQSFDVDHLKPLKPKLHWFAGEKDKKFLNLFQDLRVEGFIEDVHVVKGAGHRVIFDNPAEMAHQLVQTLKL